MAISEFGYTNIEEVKKLEEMFDVELPADYVEFICKHNGGVVAKDDKNNINANNLPATFTIDVLFGINTGNKNADISQWMNQYKDEILDNSLIIGDSIEHGFVVLVCKGKDMGVYYWDDTYHFDYSNDNSNAYFIANTFNDFIKNVI